MTRQVRELKRLITDLQAAGPNQYKGQLKIVHDFLTSTSVFRTMLEHLEASEPELLPEQWIETHIRGAQKTRHAWPEVERQKMKVLWWVLKHVATDPQANPSSWGMHLSYAKRFDEAVAVVTTEIIAPLVNYLLAQLGTESEILHFLERFKRQVEWFDREELYSKFAANTAKGEEIYDQRLREFLFAQGLDYPFSQAAGPAGKADIIAELHSDDPLVCEIKLFDGSGYGVPYVGKGLNQTVRYAHDYGKPVGHLVIINLSDKKLCLPTDGSKPPPRIVTQGITVFMSVVDGKPRATARGVDYARITPPLGRWPRSSVRAGSRISADGRSDAVLAG